MAVQFKTPERCLLVQAALYISGNKLPIPDAAYLSAPDRLVTCPKNLIRSLREKLIVASGSLCEAYRTSQIATDTILAFEPFSWPVVLHSLGMFVADLFKRPNRATPNSGYV
jgi:hypothetical protein